MKTGFVFDRAGTLLYSIPGMARALNWPWKPLGIRGLSVNASGEMLATVARDFSLVP